MPDLVNQWPSQPSPPQRHQYSVPGPSTSLQQPSHGPHGPTANLPRHRLSDARHPGNFAHNGRLAQQGESSSSSSNRRSPNRSPGVSHSYVHTGRYHEEDKAGKETLSRIHPPLVLPDHYHDSQSSSRPAPPSLNGVSRGPFSSTDGKLSIKSEQDANGFRSGNDKPVGEGRSPELADSLPSGTLGGSRSGGEASQSLPSLKASGLLDWSHGNTRSVDRQQQTTTLLARGPKGSERRSSPRRNEASVTALPPLYHHAIDESRTTATTAITPLSLPVGMKWLANESR
jgi:hypothetical protein